MFLLKRLWDSVKSRHQPCSRQKANHASADRLGLPFAETPSPCPHKLLLSKTKPFLHAHRQVSPAAPTTGLTLRGCARGSPRRSPRPSLHPAGRPSMGAPLPQAQPPAPPSPSASALPACPEPGGSPRHGGSPYLRGPAGRRPAAAAAPPAAGRWARPPCRGPAGQHRPPRAPGGPARSSPPSPCPQSRLPLQKHGGGGTVRVGGTAPGLPQACCGIGVAPRGVFP